MAGRGAHPVAAGAEDAVTHDPPREVATRRVTAVMPYALVAAGLVITAAGLRAARPVLAPLALAIFLAAVSLPVMGWLRRHRVPTGLAILLAMLLNAAVLAFVGWVVFQTVSELRVELPAYLDRAQALEATLRIALAARGVELAPDFYATLVQPDRLIDTATVAARNLTSVLALLLLVLLYVVFVLLESVVLPAKVRRVLGPRAAALAGGATVLAQVQRYLVLKTLVSLATGACIAAGAALLGVDFALFWGLLAFVLNYIPTIGSIIAAVPGVLVALLQLGPASALAFTGVYLAVNVTLGNVIDPILIGRQLRLAPLVVLVSLVFWGWTWGPIGAFLAVPLTIALRIGMEHSDSLRPIAALMGPPDPAASRAGDATADGAGAATGPISARP